MAGTLLPALTPPHQIGPCRTFALPRDHPSMGLLNSASVSPCLFLVSSSICPVFLRGGVELSTWDLSSHARYMHRKSVESKRSRKQEDVLAKQRVTVMSTTLRLPNSGKPSTSTTTPKITTTTATVSNPRGEYTRLALALLTVALTLGTAYSVLNHTYLDTSNPLLAHLPHPAQESSYFARKKNVLNTWFVKRAWGWTVALSTVLALSGRISSTGSQTSRTTSLWLWRITLATLVWASFTSWFFGPPLFDRVGAYTGAECVVVVPFPSDYSSSFGIDGSAIDGLGEASVTPGYDGLIGGRRDGALVNVPIEYCHTRTTITPESHAHLFTSSSSSFTSNLEEGWKEAIQSWKGGKARLYKGHDVSGHIFLLTLCILFLTDQVLAVLYPSHIIPAIKPSHTPAVKVGTLRRVRGVEAWAFQATLALLALWWWMAIMTSVYFHTPQEKLSGFLIGIAGFLITRIPYPIPEPEPSKIGVPIPDEKLRSDAMKID